MKCERCHQPASLWTGSYFNTQRICSICEDKELSHPAFAEAKAAKRAALKAGNTNYPGIGLPPDLEMP